MSIGKHIPDAIRNILGFFYFTTNGAVDGIIIPMASSGGAFYQDGPSIKYLRPTTTESEILQMAYTRFDISRVVPTALENRPASISAYLCIKY